MSDQILSPKEISTYLEQLAAGKAKTTAFALLLLGALAGMYIGFGAIVATTVSTGWSGEFPLGLKKFLAGSVFSVGLMLVVIPGSELFTGNVLMSVGLVKKTIPLRAVVRNWSFVYMGNFIGSLALALMVVHSGLLGDYEHGLTAVGKTSVAIEEAKIGLSFTQALLRGILCNMLVCLAVIMTLAARSVQGKILACYFPIMAFVTCGFEHSIANMFFIPVGMFLKGEFFSRLGQMFAHNLIPVTIGNIIGGLVIVLMNPGRYKFLREHYVTARAGLSGNSTNAQKGDSKGG
jgi:formate transporter